MSCKLIWITPDAEQMISDIARVSNPKNQGLPPGKLLSYCIRNAHWSIFEMASMCVEINTTRDIARQILRHRSFVFQEFSQRYADVSALGDMQLSKARLQDTQNRQNSIELDDSTAYLENWWNWKQHQAASIAEAVYKEALERGIAKEVARKVLPEGLTPSRLYMAGTIRSWLHYVGLRRGNGTQKEHIDVAQEIAPILEQNIPLIWKAFND